MKAHLAVALLLSAGLTLAVGSARAATGATDNSQCQACQDACAASVDACYVDMCVSHGGTDDSDRNCASIDPKKLDDYKAGYARCRTASAACQAKCVSDKLCTP